VEVQEAGGEEAAGEDIRQSEAGDEQIRRPLSQGGGCRDHSQHQSVFQQCDGTRQETDGADGGPLGLGKNHVEFQFLARTVNCEKITGLYRTDFIGQVY